MRKESIAENAREREAEVRSLRERLRQATNVVLSLVPEDLSAQLRKGLRSNSADELFAWEREFVDHLVATAPHLPKEGLPYEIRALCPLCGGSSSAPYARGFTVPVGLRRHLEGGGNARQCKVMRFIIGQTMDHMRP